MADNITNRLLDLKNLIDKYKENRAHLEGKQTALLDRLKNEFDCDTLEDAEKKKIELNQKIEKLKNEIRDGLNIIDNEINFEK